jgi:radical SAM superfamily enzyme YgiQ (UPF0313 family)
MRIALIVPAIEMSKAIYSEYPLGVGFIGTALECAGHTVRIYDQGAEQLSNAELVDTISSSEPDVVAFSMVTSTYMNGVNILKMLRLLMPNMIFIAGGVHPSLFPELTLKDGFDYVIMGEGECSTVELLKSVKQNSMNIETPGVAYFENGTYKCNLPCIPIDAFSVPLVNRKLYNLDLYSHHTVISARGCPYKCKFCCDLMRCFGCNKVRKTPLSRTLEELSILENEFNAQKIFFADDVFAASPSGIKKFCREYHKNNFSFQWVAQIRADILTLEIATLMREANCTRVYIGAESGSDTILQNAGKNLSKAQIAAGINNAKKADLTVKTGWVYGLPGTLNEQYKSIDLMLQTRPHQISIHQLIPFPGTEYYSFPKRYGIQIKRPLDFRSFAYGGLQDNFSFDYLTGKELEMLFQKTAIALEKEGYIHSDKATNADKYIYTTPFSKQSINVFKAPKGEI